MTPTFRSTNRSGRTRAFLPMERSMPSARRIFRPSAFPKPCRSVTRYESMQPRYNLLERDVYEGPLQHACESAGLAVLTYASLASGFLSGKYRSKSDLGKSVRGSRMEARLTDRGNRVLAALDSVSDRLGVTPSIVAIAWVIAQPGVTAAIASATSLDQLNELIEGATLQLDASSRKQLDESGG
jgi:aryl-alcohol dehydrogenase-like predicted oxidoreductase